MVKSEQGLVLKHLWDGGHLWNIFELIKLKTDAGRWAAAS